MDNNTKTAAYREEKIQLDRYYDAAYAEIKALSAQTAEFNMSSPGYFGGDERNFHQDIAAKNKKYRRDIQRKEDLSSTLDKPYFRRFDVEDENGKIESVYIGDKFNDPETSDGKFRVFNWQSAGSAPLIDYLMRGEFDCDFHDLTGLKQTCILNRRIDISKRRLLHVDDEYISSELYAKLGINDQFLINVIKQRRKEGIHAENIISTIQRNQYEIIRYPVDNIIVQGCAGSGKTYILMNRLSYLLANGPRYNLKAEDIIIISPNPRIYEQLSNVVKRLEVNEVRQFTPEEWYTYILRENFRLNLDNYKIIEGTTLPAAYINKIYSADFINKAKEKLTAEHLQIFNEAKALLNDSELRKWHINQGITVPDSDDFSTVIMFIRETAAQNRKQRNDYSRFCKDNNITEDMLSVSPDGTDAISAALRLKLAETDEKLAYYTGLQPLFEDYHTAKELLENTIRTFETQVSNIKARLADSFDIIRNIGSMSAAERTKLLEAQLRLEAKAADFEKGGHAEQVYQTQLSECKALVNECSENILAAISPRQTKSINQLWADIHSVTELLLQQKQALSEQLKQVDSRDRLMGNLINYAAKLKSELLDESISKRLETLSRRVLPRTPAMIVRDLINAEKEKFNISLTETISVDDPSRTKEQPVLYRSDLFLYAMAVSFFFNWYINNWKLICVDESQDISPVEYAFLNNVCSNAKFNLFGDAGQSRLGRADSTHRWENVFPDAHRFTLNENYRNARQITQYINKKFYRNMAEIGIDGLLTQIKGGPESVTAVLEQLANEHKVAAIIAKDHKLLHSYPGLSAILNKHGDLFEFLTIDASRGLEFSRAVVLSDSLDNNQLYVAMTRAISELWII